MEFLPVNTRKVNVHIIYLINWGALAYVFFLNWLKFLSYVERLFFQLPKQFELLVITLYYFPIFFIKNLPTIRIFLRNILILHKEYSYSLGICKEYCYSSRREKKYIPMPEMKTEGKKWIQKGIIFFIGTCHCWWERGKNRKKKFQLKQTRGNLSWEPHSKNTQLNNFS